MKKKFDAVGFQRKTREELSEKYNADREAFFKDLKKKYGFLKKGKSARTSDNRAQTANAKT
jgi:hypothetical protein